MKIFLAILILTFSFSKLSYSNSYLSCSDFNYSNLGYSEKWGKSWIPENLIINKNSDELYVRGKKAVITEDTDTKLKFYYKHEHKSQTYTVLKFLFFKTNNKINISFDLPGGYKTPGDIWGKCKLDW